MAEGFVTTQRKDRARTAAPPRRRRPATGGYPHSEDTRAGLIAAALEAFGESGFNGATTRAIAARAGVTLPVLAYHFNDKAGLYLACAGHIAERIGEHVRPALADVQEALARPDLPRGELVGHLVNIFSAMLVLLASEDDAPRHWTAFISREQANPTAAFDAIYDGIMGRVVGACAVLVARLLGRSPEDSEVRLRALGFMGQVLMLRTGRAAVLRTLGWPDFRDGRLAVAQAALRAQIEATFPGAVGAAVVNPAGGGR